MIKFTLYSISNITLYSLVKEFLYTDKHPYRQLKHFQEWKPAGTQYSVLLWIYEHYYFSMNSTLTVTIIFEFPDINTSVITVISTGGKAALDGWEYLASHAEAKYYNFLKEQAELNDWELSKAIHVKKEGEKRLRLDTQEFLSKPF